MTVPSDREIRHKSAREEKDLHKPRNRFPSTLPIAHPFIGKLGELGTRNLLYLRAELLVMKKELGMIDREDVDLAGTWETLMGRHAQGELRQPSNRAPRVRYEGSGQKKGSSRPVRCVPLPTARRTEAS